MWPLARQGEKMRQRIGDTCPASAQSGRGASRASLSEFKRLARAAKSAAPTDAS